MIDKTRVFYRLSNCDRSAYDLFRLNYKSLLHGLLLSCVLSSCSSQSFASNTPNLPIPRAIASTSASPAEPIEPSLLWSSDFSEDNWRAHWDVRRQGSWGWQNAQVIADETGQFSKVLRIRYPRGSASPTVSRENDAPVGGTQFYGNLGLGAHEALKLSYFVRFSEEFDFVKGGKLPGLFGGTGNTGGRIPNGRDGFSTRFMWRQRGQGEVYAYLPTSRAHGTSIGRGQWRFQPGQWHHLEQEVTLNQPGQRDGKVRVWVDGRLRLEKDQLEFRSTRALKIDGILFSTFFGGDDTSWATKKEVVADFANFAVYAID